MQRCLHHLSMSFYVDLLNLLFFYSFFLSLVYASFVVKGCYGLLLVFLIRLLLIVFCSFAFRFWDGGRWGTVVCEVGLNCRYSLFKGLIYFLQKMVGLNLKYWYPHLVAELFHQFFLHHFLLLMNTFIKWCLLSTI